MVLSDDDRLFSLEIIIETTTRSLFEYWPRKKNASDNFGME